MKKFLSLLVVCTMVLSLATVAFVSAAGEGYTVTNGTINASTGRFYLNFASKTAAGSGYATIHYDSDKVTLMKQVKTQTGEDDDGNPIYTTSYVEYTQDSGNFALAQSGCSFAAQKANVSDGNLVVQWFNTNKVNAGDSVFRLWFVAKDKLGDNFDEATFTVISDEAARVALGAEKGAGYIGTEAGDNNLAADAYTWSYKNADKSAGGDEPVDWTATVTTEPAADANYNADTIKYRTDAKDDSKIGTTAPAKKVVVFAKNTTGAKLAKETYGVTFGSNFYPGVADVEPNMYWSIILVDTDGSFLNQTSYSYTARVGTEEAAAGTVNVQ